MCYVYFMYYTYICVFIVLNVMKQCFVVHDSHHHAVLWYDSNSNRTYVLVLDRFKADLFLPQLTERSLINFILFFFNFNICTVSNVDRVAVSYGYYFRFLIKLGPCHNEVPTTIDAYYYPNSFYKGLVSSQKKNIHFSLN